MGKKTRLFSYFSIALMVFLVTLGSAYGTVLKKMGTRELTYHSNAIVVGKVKSVRSQWGNDGTKIYTYVTVSVQKCIKGTLHSSEITIRQLGGEVGGIGLKVVGTPEYKEGEEMLTFLNYADTEYFQCVGMAQGKYKIKTDSATGKKMLIREINGFGEEKRLDYRIPEEAESKLFLYDFVNQIKSIVGEEKKDKAVRRIITKPITIGEPIKVGKTIIMGGPIKIGSGVWVKSPNPALPAALTNAWNYHKSDPCVLKYSGKYMMWFNTGDQEAQRTQITYAESDNGTDWKLHAQPVLVQGPPGSWDSKDTETPTVIVDEDAPLNERYKMWYSAVDDSPKLVYRIGYATSPDGINWNKHKNNPILGPAPNSELLYGGAADQAVLKEKGVYRMWYSASGEEGKGQFWIGYATSNDGINWQKHPDNPVLDIGSDDSFESEAVGQPTVIHNGGFFEMWYTGWSNTDTEKEISDIGYATSVDGISWVKSPKNPTLRKGLSKEWDSQAVYGNTVLIEDTKYKMWYTGVKVEKVEEAVTAFQVNVCYAEME